METQLWSQVKSLEQRVNYLEIQKGKFTDQIEILNEESVRKYSEIEELKY